MSLIEDYKAGNTKDFIQQTSDLVGWNIQQGFDIIHSCLAEIDLTNIDYTQFYDAIKRQTKTRIIEDLTPREREELYWAERIIEYYVRQGNCYKGYTEMSQACRENTTNPVEIAECLESARFSLESCLMECDSWLDFRLAELAYEYGDWSF